MRCAHCGEKYESLHICSGVAKPTHAPAGPISAEPLFEPLPVGFSPVRYFRQAVAIVWFDGEAILRAASDRNALWHGVLFLAVGVLLNSVVESLIAGNLQAALSEASLLGMGFGVMLLAIGMLLYYGLFHLLARWFFGASGTYWRLVRPLFLSTILVWPAAIPFVNMIASVWQLMVFVAVCEEIEDLERWEAIVGTIGAAVPFVGLFLFAASRWPT